jgi:hypothetical protein
MLPEDADCLPPVGDIPDEGRPSAARDGLSFARLSTRHRETR